MGDRIRRAVRHGGSEHHWRDLYHGLLIMPWAAFLGCIVIAYVLSNFLFACLYSIGGNHISNADSNSLWDLFFFSVQTMSTIGYGGMAPVTLYGNILVAIEALYGLLAVAMGTGLMFARFARPTARVLFSKVAVICPYNGAPTLMFRMINERRNRIVEARLWVTLVRYEVTSEGYQMRRLYDLNLMRQQTPNFALSWTAMHIIDSSSPLYGETEASLALEQAEILVVLTGVDETFSQTIHTRCSYLASQIFWQRRFMDILSTLPDGRLMIDYGQFHLTTAVELS
ncbi:MAG: ATP-sensitive inward rectifier potassium channel 10 [Oscillatoriales cyanobacterium SM2_2_1]|nr:ATP-sensitive inward rectifier potassium channel 10 [Oscillatoriales cyanobacterium SM2_2_1]